MRDAPILQFRTRQPTEPTTPPAPPADPHGHVSVPPDAQAAWLALQGSMSRVRSTLSGSFSVRGKLDAAPAELEAIAAAALRAADAIRGMK